MLVLLVMPHASGKSAEAGSSGASNRHDPSRVMAMDQRPNSMRFRSRHPACQGELGPAVMGHEASGVVIVWITKDALSQTPALHCGCEMGSRGAAA